IRLCLARVVTPRLMRAMSRPPYFRPYGAQAFTRAVSASARILVPRFWRIYLALWLIRRWRLPATPILILPVAVSLKRFLTPLLVFSLGIFSPLLDWRASFRTATAALSAGPFSLFPMTWKRAPIEAEVRSRNLPRQLRAVAAEEFAAVLDRQPLDQGTHRGDALFARDLRARAAHARLNPAGAE